MSIRMEARNDSVGLEAAAGEQNKHLGRIPFI
jgi:hypothetical protein